MTLGNACADVDDCQCVHRLTGVSCCNLLTYRVHALVLIPCVHDAIHGASIRIFNVHVLCNLKQMHVSAWFAFAET